MRFAATLYSRGPAASGVIQCTAQRLMCPDSSSPFSLGSVSLELKKRKWDNSRMFSKIKRPTPEIHPAIQLHAETSQQSR
ncbi:hypothetical protein AVEN_45634-1 [Araneus ventricosus]|uniref:Uncharacterized protein n=1 Tax=Araneus ventricosus TaxID=182803 RepID=A0A4Y2ER45_ARAVE|nr:hypothetical protein AVEN_45634-1 [Araneus ventricosus]